MSDSTSAPPLTIQKFLEARWSEVEQSAKDEIEVAAYFRDSHVEYQWVRFVRVTTDALVRGSSFSPGAPTPQQMIARVTAERGVLREVERALRFHPAATPQCPWNPLCACRECLTVRHIVSIYGDHPELPEDWASRD